MSSTVPESAAISKPLNDRLKIAFNVVSFEKAQENAISQRQFSRQNDIPRSTLQGWIACKKSIKADPQVISFCESPKGAQFIHEIYSSALYEFNQSGSAGIRRISNFIKNSPLKPFIASSFGAIQKDAATMEKNIGLFGAEQRVAMGKGMQAKKITVCLDESFFPETCLVGIDPVSDFIILEEFAEKRDAKTWTKAMERGLAGLPVTVIQATSDEAKGLLSHAATSGAHHSPDIFHAQYEISKGTAPTVSANVRAAERAVEEAKEDVQTLKQEEEQYLKAIDQRGPGRPPCFDLKIAEAVQSVSYVEEALKEACKLQEEVATEIRGIGQDYHSFNLATGKACSSEDVKTILETRFENLYALADELELSTNSRKRIDKAKRLLPSLVATIAFFWAMVAKILEAHNFSLEVKTYIYEVLIPLAYLKMAYKKAKRDRRGDIKATIDKLTAITQRPDNPLSFLEIQIQTLVLKLASECADVFQRSSSCVEGRNGALSLYHHAGRSLTTARLLVLTVIHNFGLRRTDGSTAAQRFSGMNHPDLYKWLLERQPLPVRPRRLVIEKVA